MTEESVDGDVTDDVDGDTYPMSSEEYELGKERTGFTGNWYCERSIADDRGVAAEFHHPTGEVIIASSFIPVEGEEDSGSISAMLYRENYSRDQLEEEEIELENGSTIMSAPYDLLGVGITGVGAVRDFCKHHGRQMSWVDFIWPAQDFGFEDGKTVDEAMQESLDAYFAED